MMRVLTVAKFQMTLIIVNAKRDINAMLLFDVAHGGGNKKGVEV